MNALLYSEMMSALPVSPSTPVPPKNPSSANVSLPPRRKGGRPRGSVSAPLNKRKPDAELSQHPSSVKRRRRLEGQSATDREVERAMTRDRVNKKNALDRYMKTASFLELPDEEKENAKKTFIAQWTEQK